MLPSSRAFHSTKVRSLERSRSIPNGPRAIGAALISFRKPQIEYRTRDALKPLVPAGSTMAEMALRFILNNPDVSTIIPACAKFETSKRIFPPATKALFPLRFMNNCARIVGSQTHRVEPITMNYRVSAAPDGKSATSGMACGHGRMDRFRRRRISRCAATFDRSWLQFFDTAWVYGNGHSEKLLGEVLRKNSGKKLYVATKVPPKNREWPARASATVDESYPPAHIEEYVGKSLQNLGLDSLDLIQLHTWQDKWLSDTRLIAALEKLKSSGKVRAVGISLNRWEPFNGVKAVRAGIVDAVQVVYNIFDQNPEDELLPACREKDVAVIARVPFDEGSLTGTLTRNSKWPKAIGATSTFPPRNFPKFFPASKH